MTRMSCGVLALYSFILPNICYSKAMSESISRPTKNPGDAIGIIGIALSFIGLFPLSIILGAISRKKSKAANMPARFGTISMVIGGIWSVAALAYIGVWVLIAVALSS